MYGAREERGARGVAGEGEKTQIGRMSFNFPYAASFLSTLRTPDTPLLPNHLPTASLPLRLPAPPPLSPASTRRYLEPLARRHLQSLREEMRTCSSHRAGPWQGGLTGVFEVEDKPRVQDARRLLPQPPDLAPAPHHQSIPPQS
jgi:hypothetical protein